MKYALILHGIEGHAGNHWQQWLHDQLVDRGIKVKMPELSNSEHPDREDWLEEVLAATKDFDFSKTAIIGHSLGVATACDLVLEKGEKLDTLISVAGVTHDYGADLNGYFLRPVALDYLKLQKIIKNRVVVFSDNDPYVPIKDLEFLAKKLDAKKVRIKNGGHFNTNAGYTKFPMLLGLLKIL